MAYRRAITARAKLLYQKERSDPSILRILRDDDDRGSPSINNPFSKNAEVRNYVHRYLFGAPNNLGTSFSSKNLFGDRRFAIPSAPGPNFVRSISSLGEGSEAKIEIMSDVADVLGDGAVEAASQVAPVANEVAIAASDSFFPVAALQYLIDYVHTYTGCNWWAAIVLTSIMIRWLQLPIMIHQLKATSKFTLLRPRMDEIKEEMQSREMSPAAVAEGQARMKQLFKEYGVSPFTPLKGLLFTAPVFCCFFLAIRNMAENVPSFKEGGTLWFIDLTTPDSMYIFPVLTALTFWITVECNSQEGLEGNPAAKTIKNVSRVFAALTIPITATIPKAIFCYWITSNLFSLSYGLVMKNIKVKKLLGVPIIPVAATLTTNKKPAFSFFDTLNKLQAAQRQLPQSSPPIEDAPSKSGGQRISSSSVLNRRSRSLEKEVKGRKKGRNKTRDKRVGDGLNLPIEKQCKLDYQVIDRHMDKLTYLLFCFVWTSAAIVKLIMIYGWILYLLSYLVTFIPTYLRFNNSLCFVMDMFLRKNMDLFILAQD